MALRTVMEDNSLTFINSVRTTNTVPYKYKVSGEPNCES
jgi:hypothetical protein